jgi:hypothetical protein
MRKALVFTLTLVGLGFVAALGASFLRPCPKPEYCWLAFGPQAEVRVLVRLDGEAVSLDHYASDKPAGRTEQFKDRAECKNVALADPDGKTSYLITRLSGTGVKPGEPTDLMVSVDIRGPLEYRQYCDVVAMGADPKTAPMAHFHGPLTVEAQTVFWKLPPDLALHRGDKPTDLRAFVGTMDAQRGCWVVVRTHEGQDQLAFPKGVHPFVDVEFPARKPGDPPIQKRYPLDQFC